MVAIVNRRKSDLVDKADGVLYTSDGRDVEMSVASTKAFYSQVAAGFLLAFAIAAERRAPTTRSRARTGTSARGAARRCPDAMTEVIGRRAGDRRGRATARAAAGDRGRSSATA